MTIKDDSKIMDNPPHIASLVQELWERCSDGLSTKELEWFSKLGGSNDLYMRNLESTIEGVACLVAGDNGDNGKPLEGSFQSASDVSAFMFLMADAIRQTRAITMVSEEATNRLLMRARKDQAI